mgnify:CR=1 FL=1
MSRAPSLASRLLAMMLLVVAVGATTFIVTAALIAPSLFSEHLKQAGDDSPALQSHAVAAFQTAFTLSVTIAVVLASGAAVAVAWVFSRRVGHTISALAAAARRVADGDYTAPIPGTSFGRELTDLSGSFAQMARTLADTDTARNRLLADLAHEIRTPLATLQAYIDGLDDGVLDADADTYATMRAQVERIGRLSTDLRDAAAAQEGALAMAMAPCDATEVVADAVAAALPAYDAAGIDLRFTTQRHAHVRADRQRIGQVLANLLVNAARHTSPGGHVEVGTAVVGDRVCIDVTDDGEGIPVDELDAIFERFHRVDTARSANGAGSGLGLTISRSIATAHGGTLAATSDGPGHGARFRLTLPAYHLRN